MAIRLRLKALDIGVGTGFTDTVEPNITIKYPTCRLAAMFMTLTAELQPQLQSNMAV